MLQKANRISSARLIGLLFKKGQLYRSKHFLIRFLPSLHNNNQFAVVISKKTRNKAVERNRIKRQISEILRLKQKDFNPPMVAIISLKPSDSPFSYTSLNRGILDFLTHYQHSNHV